MKQDELFAEGKEFSDSFLIAAKDLGRSQLKTRFKKLEPVKNVRRLNLYWVAASIAILITASIFIFRPPSEQQLYATYYQKMPNKVVAITRGNSDEKDLIMAFIAYEKEDYSEASDLFLALEQSSPEVKIYLGIIEMEKSNYDQAIKLFGPLIEDPNFQFTIEAKWYAALSYLKIKDKDMAIKYLEEIIIADHVYAPKAKKLLDQL